MSASCRKMFTFLLRKIQLVAASNPETVNDDLLQGAAFQLYPLCQLL